MDARHQIEPVQLSIRGYEPEDLEALWRLDQRCFEEGIAYGQAELRQYVQLKMSFTLIAEHKGSHEICGFIIAHRRRGGYGHILTIDVEPEYRKQGVGTLLLNAAHERLALEGCHTIFLETAVNNVAAMAFYKRHGYAVLRTLPRYYQATGLDAFLLSKPLAAQPAESE